MSRSAAALDRAPVHCRVSSQERGRSQAVDREHNIISGVAVLTIGEALGHDAVLDRTFANQILRAGNSSARGFKSRFTHPGLSSDGLGKHLGRVSDFFMDGDVLRGDLRLSQTAMKPSTNGRSLGEQILDLAEEDPEVFGASIVFDRDLAQEENFKRENMQDGQFKSPDASNPKNLDHFRLAEGTFRAVDMVGDPAANPGGLLAEGPNELPAIAERVLAFSTGLSSDAPGPLLGIAPERVKEFLTTFLARNGLEITHVKEADAMSTPATLKQLAEEFEGHNDFIVEQQLADASIEDARTAFAARKKLDEKDDRIAELEKELEEAKAANLEGHDDDDDEDLADHDDDEDDKQKLGAVARGAKPRKFRSRQSAASGNDFMAQARAKAKAEKTTVTDAMRALSVEQPDLHDALLVKAHTDAAQRNDPRNRRRR